MVTVSGITVSVITAVHPQRSDWLRAAYDSLLAQEADSGAHEWEWLVQCDSAEVADVAAVRALLPGDDPRIKIGASRKGGPGIARTMALARAQGDYLKVLDADDRLTPGALARDIAALSRPGVGWTVSRVLNVAVDGTTSAHYPSDPPAGRLPAGSVGARWKEQFFAILVHPATLCAKRGLVEALGGWMALPASEDTGLLMALDAVSDGWFHDEVGLLYRKWPAQMTASPAHYDPAEREARYRLISARIAGLSALLRPGGDLARSTGAD